MKPSKDLLELIVRAGELNSSSEARRLVKQGAIRINDQIVNLDQAVSLKPSVGDILSVGKRTIVKIGSP